MDALRGWFDAFDLARMQAVSGKPARSAVEKHGGYRGPNIMENAAPRMAMGSRRILMVLSKNC